MVSRDSKIELEFADGHKTVIDKRTADLISTLQEQASQNEHFSSFYKIKSFLDKSTDFVRDFFYLIPEGHLQSHSQLFQDLFVLYILHGKRNGIFLEFGATDGKSLSNTLLLEEKFGWGGVLIEPSPQWKKALHENRPKSKILDYCVYSESNKSIEFFVSDAGELSTIGDYKNSDKESVPGNSAIRNKGGYTCLVNTISLNDVFENYFKDAQVDYMSVDTEGSEMDILSNFDFKKYKPSVITVEHNFTDAESRLDTLLASNGYLRKFRDFTAFDAWYIYREIDEKNLK